MSNSDATKITLISRDGVAFEVETKVAMLSEHLANMIEDGCCAGTIPVPNVTAGVLAKVLQYCKKHAVVESSTDKEAAADEPVVVNESSDDKEAAADEPVADEPSADDRKVESVVEPVVDESLETWDKEFAKVDTATLYDLLMAANFLSIQGLLDLLVQTTADLIKGKSPEEIRKTFNIVNDFTPEEEQEIRNENKWAFE